MSKEDTIRYLISAWLNETTKKEIQNIDLNALKKVTEILSKKLEVDKIAKDDLSHEILTHELRILKFILNDLVRVRLEKLLSCIFGDGVINYDALLPHERKFITQLLNMITNLSKAIVEEPIISTEDLDLLTDQDIEIKKEDVKYNIVISEEDIPTFIGVDGYVYRGIKIGDVFSAPQENIQAFRYTKLRIII